ncbi:putative GTP-binding protein EngB (fragment) [Methylocella tundrae]
MRDFLRGRASLLRVFVLVDGRHGLKPVDAEMMDLLDRSAMSYQIVLTKRDEVKAAELDKRVEETLKAIEKRPAAFPQVIFTSSQSFAGIPDLRAGIARLMAERGF